MSKDKCVPINCEERDFLVGRIRSLQQIPKGPNDPIVGPISGSLAERNNAIRPQNLDWLFDSQVETLRNRGCPLPILSMLQIRKGSIIRRVSTMTFSEGGIPFLPVITDSLMNFDRLMFMVRNGEKVGLNFLNPDAICNLVETPIGLYHIYDVEDGTATRKKTFENVVNMFQQQSRSALTVAEIITLSIHGEVLSQHNIYASNSRCDGTDSGPDAVPAVFLDPVHGQPGLYGGRADFPADWWGFPSCRERR